jgi:hypothetical protein
LVQMLNMKIKITWPLLIVLLIALVAYLTRDPGPHAAPQRRPAPRPASPTHRRTPRDRDGGEYDTETRRLDEEAAAAGQQALDQTIIIDLPEPSWRRKS